MIKLKRLLSMLLTVIMVVGLIPIVPVPVKAAGASLNQLRSDFPDGSYWNHYVSKAEESSNYYRDYGISDAHSNSISNTPCWSHAIEGYNPYTGHYDCNRFGGATQCKGFAYKLAYCAYGTVPTSWGKGTKSTLKAGDVLVYWDSSTDPEWGHTVFIIGRSGSTVTVAECNWGEKCRIKWDRSINLDSLTIWDIFSAPYALEGGNTQYEPSTILYPTDNSIVKFVAGVGNNMYLDFDYLSDNVQIYENSDGDSASDSVNRQYFKLTHIEDGWYTITNIGNGNAMDIYNRSSESGANIIQYGLHYGDNQLFRFYDAGDGYCYIKSKLGNYVDVANAENVNNANVWAYSFNGSNAQKWKIQISETTILYPPDNSIVKFAAGVGNNMCLDFDYWGDNVQIYENRDGDSNLDYVKCQLFRLTHIDDGWYTITNIGNGNAMDIDNRSSESGANIIQYELHNGDNQLFRFYDAGNGYCYIKSKLGNYVDVANAENANNTNVWAHKFNGSNAQKWEMYIYEDSAPTILGDVNADKKVDSVDYLLVKRACFKTYALSEEEAIRADVNVDKQIDSTDYLLVKRIAFGTYTVK